ncbi:MAG TPA: hypothetical protein VJ063_10540 [Verrucomicrobiae bacterium]|nr:hypothetical protein [Verrucomicrobiae bacterium]
MHIPKGKIARLPGKLRNQVNEMLYDGISYTKVIAWLEEQGHPGFNEMNISRWREGGYQAWLSAQERQDHRDFLHDLAQEAQPGDTSFHDASIHLAQLQFFEALNRLEGADLAIMVKENRKEFIQLLKTFTHFNRYCLHRDKFRNHVEQQEKAERQRNKPPKESLTDENMDRICSKFNLK